MKLYDLTSNYALLLDQLESEDDVNIKDTLDSIKDAIDFKAENIGKLMKSLDANIEAIKAEEKRLADRRRALENRKQGLLQYLEDSLRFAGIDKIKTPLITVAFQKNPPKVEIDEDILLDETYLVYSAPTPNKKLLMQELKNGVEIPGVRLIQTESLRVK